MTDPAAALDLARRRIQDLEARLEESEETLAAIRRGDIDALVVSGDSVEHRVYTLENADHPYRVLIEQIQEGAVTLDRSGAVFYGNRWLASMLDVPQERLVGQFLPLYMLLDERPAFEALFAAADQGGARGEFTLVSAEGVHTPVYLSISRLHAHDDGLFCGVLTDLTEQKMHLHALSEANARLVAESAQRLAVEEALRQSQKMEAVGQLTGGLAHDFNNLLTGITGSLELMRTRIAQARYDELNRYITAAEGASKRAAALTHRLLAFSRRQTLAPKAIDISSLIADMEEMVRRTVGPRVRLEVAAGRGLWNTLVDPNQLENALLNLCINARDAMPNGGVLTIALANHTLDAAAAARTVELAAGDYVSLCVTDSGTGMAPEVIARAFDPFFTTKPIGKGTGLGLSMIYGFVRQSGGRAHIASELGHGTTVCLYLPRYHGDAEREERPATASSVAGERRGTIVVVDDEPTVRMLVTDVLQDRGYHVIAAPDGAAGLLAMQSDIPVDLLITDVGLPGALNGRQVADAARTLRRDLKVLFITGYAAHAGLSGEHFDMGMQVLTKPFSVEALFQRVQQLMGHSA